MQTFADLCFAYQSSEAEFGDALVELSFGSYTHIGFDHYDTSIEFYEVDDGDRLSEAAQRYVYDAGFLVAYLNHKDGWETHYNWKRDGFVPVEGYRTIYEDKQRRLQMEPQR